MKFDEFLSGSWNDHAKDAKAVAARLEGGLPLISKSEEIPAFAGLVTHVLGEHLGRWSDGIAMLERLRTHSAFSSGSECDHSVRRSIASLSLASGNASSVDGLSASDKIRVLAVASSALSEQKKTTQAQKLFREALHLAKSGLTKEDPANRALAVTGNNLASALEERESRSKEETELMILAARSAREFWDVAGGWLQVERAEYRLANSYLKAGDAKLAHEHASKCIAICEENHADPLEFFFGYEILAKSERARGNSGGYTSAAASMKLCFEKLTPDDQSWCRASLDKLAD